MAEGIQDFSIFNKPITDFLGDYPKTTDDWNKFKLSDEQVRKWKRKYFEVAFYEKNGYLTNIKVLSEQQVNLLLKELEQISTGTHKAHKLWYEFQRWYRSITK